jgi:phosphatidylglycerol lysyltransferase
MREKTFRYILPAAALILFTLAVWTFHSVLRNYTLVDIKNAIIALPADKILLSVFLTVLSYLTLAGYEILAFYYAGQKPQPMRILVASFLSYAFANNTGSWSIIASSSVRYRLYGGWGLTADVISRIISFCMGAFSLGFLLLAGLSFVLHPLSLPDSIHLPGSLPLRALGLLFCALVAGYILLVIAWKKPLRFRKWQIPLPTPILAMGQISVAAFDLLCAGTALYVLLGTGSSLTLPVFMECYLLALLAGLISTIPGGLGIFEAVMLLLLADYLPHPAIVGALLAYRVIYYLLPLAVATVLLGALEAYRGSERARLLTNSMYRMTTGITPQILALATFVSGAVLLFSGSLPSGGAQLSWFQKLIPFPVRELTHFLGSLTGMGLLLLASALRRRIDGAYVFSAVLLSAAIVFAFIKGVSFLKIMWLVLVLSTLFASRKQFHRQASLLAAPFSAGWLTSLLLVLIGTIWLGFFIHRHQEYTNDLWWRFAVNADAPRFLRATTGAVILMVFFALARLLKAQQPTPALPAPDDLQRAAAIVSRSWDSNGSLSLLGDKSLLFHDKGDAFLMFGVKGRCWIAMGDPVGPPVEGRELLWRFRELADYHGGWPVFYEVSPSFLGNYIDLGLTAVKIGEQGRVFLPGFSLAGRQRKEFRNTHNRFHKEGYVFEVVEKNRIAELLPELEAVSDAWLTAKNTREKGFSLGFFNARYLSYFPMATVSRHTKIMAFTNLWLGADQQELSPDLMRYYPDAPHGIMDYLFIELMLWGRGRGYQWFNLGMAPLAGLEQRQIFSLWSGLGSFLYRHGEHFYNFKGLREYKEKFDPRWEARYLIAPGILSLPVVFADLSSLIAGSLKGVVSK